MSTQPIEVRIATIADKPEVWRLVLQAHHENGLFPPDLAKADWFINRFLQPDAISPMDTGVRGAIGVIGNGYLEGLAIVTFGEFWYTSHKHLEEWLVYVDPGCRTSGYATALVNWMKSQASLTGLPLVTGILSNHRTEAKVRLYEKMLPKAGAYFFYNPTLPSSGNSLAVH